MSSKIVAIGAFALLMLASGRAGWAAPPTNACALLTPAQISAVLGAPVGAGHGFARLCHWVTQAGKHHGVLVGLKHAQDFAYAKMPIGHGIVKVPVKGIGDDAVYGATPGFPTELTVLKGQVAFSVYISGFPDDQIKAKEKELALDILKKL